MDHKSVIALEAGVPRKSETQDQEAGSNSSIQSPEILGEEKQHAGSASGGGSVWLLAVIVAGLLVSAGVVGLGVSLSGHSGHARGSQVHVGSSNLAAAAPAGGKFACEDGPLTDQLCTDMQKYGISRGVPGIDMFTAHGKDKVENVKKCIEKCQQHAKPKAKAGPGCVAIAFSDADQPFSCYLYKENCCAVGLGKEGCQPNTGWDVYNKCVEPNI